MLRRNTEQPGYEIINPERRREMARYATQHQDGHDRRYQDDYGVETDYYDDEEEDERPVSSYRSRSEENDWNENEERAGSYHRPREQDWNEEEDYSHASNEYEGFEDYEDEDVDERSYNERNYSNRNYNDRSENERNYNEGNYHEPYYNDRDYNNRNYNDRNYNERRQRRGAFYSTPEKGRRGFASMSRDEVSRLGRQGGLASHRNDRTNREDNRSSETRERRREGTSSRSNESSSQRSNSNSSRRGFAAMSPEKVSRIARKGGLASHKNQQSSSSSRKSTSTKRSGNSRNR